MEADNEDNKLNCLLEGLSEADQKKLCDGDLCFDSGISFISLKVFGAILNIVDQTGYSHNVTIPNILKCINKDLPYESDISNMVKKYKKLNIKAERSDIVDKSKILNEVVIKIRTNREPDVFELFFDTDMLKKGVIKESDPSLTFTNEIFLKLGGWVAKEKKLIWSSVSCWLKNKCFA